MNLTKSWRLGRVGRRAGLVAIVFFTVKGVVWLVLGAGVLAVSV
jgi:hypothetical protein